MIGFSILLSHEFVALWVLTRDAIVKPRSSRPYKATSQEKEARSGQFTRANRRVKEIKCVQRKLWVLLHWKTTENDFFIPREFAQQKVRIA